VGARISAGTEIEIEIERGIVIFLKIIFFFFGRCSISVGIIKDFTIMISSALEISTLEADLIYY